MSRAFANSFMQGESATDCDDEEYHKYDCPEIAYIIIGSVIAIVIIEVVFWVGYCAALRA